MRWWQDQATDPPTGAWVTNVRSVRKARPVPLQRVAGSGGCGAANVRFEPEADVDWDRSSKQLLLRLTHINTVYQAFRGDDQLDEELRSD